MPRGTAGGGGGYENGGHPGDGGDAGTGTTGGGDAGTGSEGGGGGDGAAETMIRIFCPPPQWAWQKTYSSPGCVTTASYSCEQVPPQPLMVVPLGCVNPPTSSPPTLLQRAKSTALAARKTLCSFGPA